jgi:hypothetical protein
MMVVRPKLGRQIAAQGRGTTFSAVSPPSIAASALR